MAWNNGKRVADALSGNVELPATRYRLYAFAAVAIVAAVCVAVAVLRGKPENGSAANASGQSPAPAAAEDSRAVMATTAKSSSAEAPKLEFVVLPPVVLGERRPGTKSLCPENELEQVRGGAESWGAAMAALQEARRVEASAGGDLAALEKARRLYQQALDTGRLEDKEDAACLVRLTELTDKIVLDPKVACATPPAVLHKVEPGDGVEKLARKYKVNQGQVKRLNKLNDKLVIRYGQTLKILPGDVFFRASRTRLIGTLYIDGVFIRRYPIGIGPGNATPQGVFTVERKVTDPDWYCEGKRIAFGDPANILGTRWMALATTDGSARADGLGIHGTSKPDTVPGRESKGCVRMLNSDVEELYDLMPQGGKVEILE